MEKIKSDILYQLLDCGVADIDKLCYIYIKNDVIPDIEESKSIFGKINVDILIYEAIREVAEKFIYDYKNEIHSILNLGDFGNLDDYRAYNDLYEVYANGLDSHLYFISDEIQNLFNTSKYDI